MIGSFAAACAGGETVGPAAPRAPTPAPLRVAPARVPAHDAPEVAPGVESDEPDAPPAAPVTPPPEPAERYPFNEPLSPGPIESTPAARYAKLTPSQCRAELRRRSLAVSSAKGKTRGIATPLRLASALGGVRFAAPGARVAYGVLDCRLVLTLDDLAPLLAKNGVVQVYVDNFYRPHAHLPGKRKRSQHAYGLAADVTGFRLGDGRTLSVERDWHGPIGAAVCGPDARLDPPADDDAISLRNIVCQIAQAGLFHHILSPSFNAAHRTHLHLDIARDGWAIQIH